MPTSTDEIVARFRDDKALPDEVRQRLEVVRSLFLDLALDMNSKLPEGRYKAMALTSLEEASRSAIKALCYAHSQG